MSQEKCPKAAAREAESEAWKAFWNARKAYLEARKAEGAAWETWEAAREATREAHWEAYEEAECTCGACYSEGRR